jgi:hypothetical protein
MTDLLHAIALMIAALLVGLAVVGAFRLVFRPRCVRTNQGE